ncbi:MAG: amino acid permease [Bdellovibrionota bacterium]
MKDPKRNIPRSLILGMAAVLFVYALANISYFYLLPNSEIITSFSDTYPDALPVATRQLNGSWADLELLFYL